MSRDYVLGILLLGGFMLMIAPHRVAAAHASSKSSSRNKVNPPLVAGKEEEEEEEEEEGGEGEGEGDVDYEELAKENIPLKERAVIVGPDKAKFIKIDLEGLSDFYPKKKVKKIKRPRSETSDDESPFCLDDPLSPVCFRRAEKLRMPGGFSLWG